MKPEDALSDNKRYRIVWEVLQALRAHDERFDALVNKIDLNTKRDDKVNIIGVGGDGEAEDADRNPKRDRIGRGEQGRFDVLVEGTPKDYALWLPVWLPNRVRVVVSSL